MFDDDDICLNLGDSNSDSHDTYNFYSEKLNKPILQISDDKLDIPSLQASSVVKPFGKLKNSKTSNNISSSHICADVKEQQIIKKGDTNEQHTEIDMKYKIIEISSSIVKAKPKWSKKDDPSLFHASPRYLSQGAAGISELNALNTILEAPLESLVTDYIFTRTKFESMSVDPKLIEILQAPHKKNGLNLTTSTRVQSVSIPLLINQHNMLIKSQTGSGKTLSYLIPILNDLMTRKQKIQRSDGTHALIIAPTRELCSQITDVLAKLTQACVYIVGGLITGGEKRKSEKARLRKGVGVLVSTPGRLLDHLKATESFCLSNLKWIVLDEADRLLDMGFEQTILEILSIVRGHALNGLKNVLNMNSPTLQAKKCKNINEITHIMVSATMTHKVQELAFETLMTCDKATPFLVIDADNENIQKVQTLNDLLTQQELLKSQKRKFQPDENGILSFENDNDNENHIALTKQRSTQYNNNNNNNSNINHESSQNPNDKLDTPQQLSQYYMNVTCKWRLAALVSFLRTKVTVEKLKVMVFFSTCDAVDYHTLLMRETEWPLELDHMDNFDSTSASSDIKKASFASNRLKKLNDHLNSNIGHGHGNGGINNNNNMKNIKSLNTKINQSILGKDVSIFRLHGNMGHSTRQQVYQEFCQADTNKNNTSNNKDESSGSVLFCTDVAARGLDLPQVDWILQYDAPCDITDYVHRAGRTARRGLIGSSLLFLLPSEAAFISLLYSYELKPVPLSLQSLFMQVSLHIPGALKFKNMDEIAAVILQRRLELVVQDNQLLLQAGEQTFRSYVRAYATHSTETKGIFRVQLLHLGHVAKSFALRTNPSAIKTKQDIIGEIANGKYETIEITEKCISKDDEKRARNEKYSLSNQSKLKQQGHDKNMRGDYSSDSNKKKRLRQEESTFKTTKKNKNDKLQKSISSSTYDDNDGSNNNSNSDFNIKESVETKTQIREVNSNSKTLQKVRNYTKKSVNKVNSSKIDQNKTNNGNSSDDKKTKTKTSNSIRKLMTANINSEFHA